MGTQFQRYLELTKAQVTTRYPDGVKLKVGHTIFVTDAGEGEVKKYEGQGESVDALTSLSEFPRLSKAIVLHDGDVSEARANTTTLWMWSMTGETDSLTASQIPIRCTSSAQALQIGTVLLAKIVEDFHLLENDSSFDQTHNFNLVNNLATRYRNHTSGLVLGDGADMTSSAPNAGTQSFRVGIGSDGTNVWYMDVYLQNTGTSPNLSVSPHLWNWGSNSWTPNGSLIAGNIKQDTSVPSGPSGGRTGGGVPMYYMPVEIELNA